MILDYFKQQGTLLTIMGVASLLTVPFQIIMENTEQLAKKAAQAQELGRSVSAQMARTVSGKLCHGIRGFERMWITSAFSHECTFH